MINLLWLAWLVRQRYRIALQPYLPLDRAAHLNKGFAVGHLISRSTVTHQGVKWLIAHQPYMVPPINATIYSRVVMQRHPLSLERHPLFP